MAGYINQTQSIQDQEKQRLYAKQKADALEADVAALKQRDKLQAEASQFRGKLSDVHT